MYRICFLGYPEPKGDSFGNGVARVEYEMAQLLRQRGHDVFFYHLFSTHQYKKLNRFLNENKIQIALWHMTTLKIKRPIHTPCPLISLWHTNPTMIHELEPFLQKYKIKGTNFLNSKAGRGLFKQLHRLFDNIAFLYITMVSKRMILLSPGYIPHFFPSKLFPKKVIAIHNFIKLTNIQQIEKQKEVLYLGRLNNTQKRLDLLLKIWSNIEEKAPDWKLIICGDGPDKEMLKNLSTDLKLQHIEFKGHVTDTDYYFKRVSIFCMTSAIEGMPMVLLEASCHGVIPMAFNTYEAAPDLIKDNYNGRLIEPYDTTHYTSALLELLKNKPLREKLQYNAMTYVQQFSSDKIINQWEELFKSILKH